MIHATWVIGHGLMYSQEAPKNHSIFGSESECLDWIEEMNDKYDFGDFILLSLERC